MQVNCKICTFSSSYLLKGEILKSHSINYYQCDRCKFIQTEEPYWINDAYNSNVDFLDVGLLSRNLRISDLTKNILEKLDNAIEQKYLDFGGGIGLFVRLMRDAGYDFKLFDKYSENIFARFFNVEDLDSINEKFAAITAFEVLEHLVNPMEDIGQLAGKSDVIIFSTELVPSKILTTIQDWWYFVPESGQHVAFYHHDTLSEIANYFGFNLYSNKMDLHIFSRREIKNPFAINLIRRSLIKLDHLLLQRKRTSFLQKDFEYYKSIINA